MDAYCSGVVKGGKDVSVHALTGSGKTLAYLIPAFELLLRRASPPRAPELSCLVVLPTRELALQVHAVALHFASNARSPPPLLVTGGRGTAKEDLARFLSQGSDMLIGTPGRVHDCLTRYSTVDCRTLDLLILDEADSLLGMGFTHQLDGILGALPRMRRTGLFSATMNGEVERLGKVGLRNCVYVKVDTGSGSKRETPSTLSNYYLTCPLHEKLSRLLTFLLQHGPTSKTIAFFLTCAEADFIGMFLKRIVKGKLSFVEVIHGKLHQSKRTEIMSRYRSASSGVMICTDVAARGLDVGDIDYVMQFDPPQDPATFVHRVGRAARAGRRGRSMVFLTEEEESYVDFMRRRGVKIEEVGEGEECGWEMEKTKVEDEGKEEGEGEGEENEEEEMDVSDEAKFKATDTITSSGKIRSVLPKLRNLCLTDRDYLEKGTKAFTSWVRGYKEHQLAFVFRWKKVDLGSLATSFALLKLPKMPELKECHDKLKGFTPAGREVDIVGITYKDKEREKQRQTRLKKEGGKNKKALKAEQKKADKAQRKKEWEQKQRDLGKKTDVKKRGRNERIRDEWDELGEEERMYKRMRKGKISKEEYERWERGDRGEKKGKEEVEDDSDGSED
ncbi:hypothetical protein TrRE_jg9815 [Triparma retinervis]|uniref:Uncharacterized protein n=1 Tax=Triparma retinervis TaxID=2557542 RepID=A0A9W7KS85_9STRA|nr:hypothetical protein TrRE_jg9815 [Triparma retinervis]